MYRLLYLLPFPPRRDAAHGGSRVMAELLVRLAERHRLALLYFRSPDDPPLDDLLQQRCEIVRQVPRPPVANTFAGRWLLRARIIWGWIHGRPILATTWNVTDYRKELASLLDAWQPQLIQVEFHMMGQYHAVLERSSAPRILVEHEPGLPAARDLLQSARGFAQLLFYFDKLAWHHFERNVVRNVDSVVVFTGRDRQALEQLGLRTPLVCIPLQTTPPAEPMDPLGQSPPHLLFVGSFIHPPNVDAALRLLQRIFPRVQALVPEARLDIVGGQPPPQLRQIAKANEKVTVTGFVPSVAPYMEHAAVVVAPMRMGGGMRVKVLEAIAAGKALVASSRALEGLDLIDGQHILLAESDAEFCEEITRLLSEPDRRAQIATNARAWACSNLSWDRAVAAYEKLYTQRILAEAHRTVPPHRPQELA